MQNLTATLQASYYGKAKVREENGFLILRSYDTDVLRIDVEKHTFSRLWNGWSATTAKHVNDFLKQNGFNVLSKKEWLALPCVNNEPVYNVYMSNGFTCHKCPALLTAEEAERETDRLYKKHNRVCAWYD